MDFNRRTVKTLMLLIAFAVVINAAIHNISAVSGAAQHLLGILSPLLYGLAFAFLLNIPMSILEKKVFKPRGRRALKLQRAIRRPLSMILSVLFVLLIVSLVSSIVLPRLISSIASIFAQMPGWVDALKLQIQRFEDDAPELVGWIEAFNFDWEGMQEAIVNFLKQGLGLTLGSVASVATSMFGTATNTAISFIFALSVLAAKEKLQRQLTLTMRAFMPAAPAERTLEILHITNLAFSGFITGQLTEACILGALCFGGMSIFQFPDAFFISTLVGVAAVVPIFGAFVSATIGALLIAAAEGLGRGLGFALFFIILQQLEGNLIYPRVMGHRIGLPAIWVLAAIAVGGGMLGVIGMLISIPIFAVGYALMRETVRVRTKRRKAKETKGAGDADDQGA